VSRMDFLRGMETLHGTLSMWNPMRGYCVGDVFFADEMDVSRMDTVISLSISPLSQVIWNT